MCWKWQNRKNKSGITGRSERICPFLLFLIKATLVPIGSQLDTGQPGRSPTHLFTDCIQRYVRTALDDELVVYVPDNLAVTECTHGICQDVPADRLNYVFDKFRTVGFDPAPFLLRIDPHVGDRLSAETVLTDTGLYISQAPAGRKRDEQHPTLNFECDVPDFGLHAFFDCLLDGGIDSPPVSCDVWITAPPLVYKGTQLFLGKSHV